MEVARPLFCATSPARETRSGGLQVSGVLADSEHGLLQFSLRHNFTFHINADSVSRFDGFLKSMTGILGCNLLI